MRTHLLSPLLIIVFCFALVKLSIPILENFLIINKPLPRADALVVMAGSTQERLPVAAHLFLAGISPKILLTNDGVLGAWSEEKHRNLYRVEWAEADLKKMRVPEKAIVKLAYSSSGSIYDALNSRKEILGEGYKSIMIVTSDYHTRRSMWSFERVLRGHHVTIGVCPVNSEMNRMSDFIKFLELSREMIKYIYYTFQYSHI